MGKRSLAQMDDLIQRLEAEPAELAEPERPTGDGDDPATGADR